MEKNKLIIFFNEIPDRLLTFEFFVDDEFLAKAKAAHGNYVNTTGCNEEAFWLIDQIYDERGELKLQPLADGPMHITKSTHIVVFGMVL